MTRGSFAAAAGAIALVAVVLRVGYVFALGAHPPLGLDGTWYALQAGTIADGAGYVDPSRYYGLHGAFPTAQFPPLWPGFLAVVHELGFESLRSYRIAGGFVGAATVVLTAYLGRSIAGARIGLVAAAIVAASPFLIAADGSLMAESLFVALVTAALLVMVRAGSKPGIATFAGLGLLLGMATLTRSDGIIVTVVLVAVAAWRVPGAWTRRLGLGAVALLIAVATLVPWTVRNTDALGEAVVLSSNSGGLLAGANCPATYGGHDLGGWVFGCADAADPHHGSEVARAAAARSEGLRYLREHASRLVAVVPVRVLRGWGLWNPSRLADAEVIESRTRTFQLIGWPIEVALLALAGAGAVIAVRRRLPVAPLFAVIGAATVVLATSWGNQRFRLVAEPALAVLGALALVAIASRLGGRENAGAGAGQKEPVRP